MLQIVWKQKHQREHGTCDKKILTPPSIIICPLFGELKKGDFFYPPPPCMDQLLLSNFFFGRHPSAKLWLNVEFLQSAIKMISENIHRFL